MVNGKEFKDFFDEVERRILLITENTELEPKYNKHSLDLRLVMDDIKRDFDDTVSKKLEERHSSDFDDGYRAAVQDAEWGDQ